jgi:hypothetical protein
MSRLRSSLNRRAVAVLSVLLLGAAWLAYAATSPTSSTTPTSGTATRTEFGTVQQQEEVRTDREVSTLPLQSACSVVPDKELFITNVSVVDDCWRTTWFNKCPTPTVFPATRGAWTMGGLLPGIFGTNNAATLSARTLQWLNEWDTLQTINGDNVPARTFINDLIIDPWLAASGGLQLDMKKAPFRLLAIVARLDLRQNSGYSGGNSAGEGRFVFNVLDEFGNTTEFLVILEYGLDAADCATVLQWANAWHALGGFPFGAGYNAELQEVTDAFTAIGASPGKPNGSAINQVRSNEIELVQFLLPWELREFRLNGMSLASPSPLEQVTVAQTPARSRDQTAQLADYVNTNAASILTNTHLVPLSWLGAPFRGGASPHSLELGWDGPVACTSILDDEARHVFSLNTCSGCHGEETDTTFKHVEPRAPGVASALSTFLTGGAATDRCGLTHKFGDIERRRVDLCQLLTKSCTDISKEKAITFVH